MVYSKPLRKTTIRRVRCENSAKGLAVIGVEPLSQIRILIFRKSSMGTNELWVPVHVANNHELIGKIKICCFKVFAKLIVRFFIRNTHSLLMFLYMKASNFSINITFRFSRS